MCLYLLNSFYPLTQTEGVTLLPLPWPMAVCVSVSCNTVPFINTFDVFVVAESAESFFHLLTHGEGLEEDRSLASLILSSAAILRSSLFLYFHISYLFEHILGCSQTSGHRSSCSFLTLFKSDPFLQGTVSRDFLHFLKKSFCEDIHENLH